MKLFPYGHATHPEWEMAVPIVLAQLRAQMALPGYATQPTLALLYITDHYSRRAQDILDQLSAELPYITDWSGTVGNGVVANNVEYFDDPAMVVMLCEFGHDQYRVFSGVSPLPPAASGRFKPHTALVHADAATPELADLIAELAARTESGYVFGGVSASRAAMVQFALSGHGNLNGQGAATGVFAGGMSGVAFARDPAGGMALMSRLTQGCRPVGPEHEITACEGHRVYKLGGRPALDVMLEDYGLSLSRPRELVSRIRKILVGLSRPSDDFGEQRHAGHFGGDVLVRHLVGVEQMHGGIALADKAEVGMRLTFCERHAEAARTDLVRVCSEIREELAPEEILLEVAGAADAPEGDVVPAPVRYIAGAVYVSCTSRGGPHFGAPSAEMQIVRRALGDVPLIGFYAAGEIARNHLYSYTGVLTVFTSVE